MKRRTWKASPDRDYQAKAERVIALCKRAPEGSAVVSCDQMGPVSLRPMPGAGWAPRKRPERQRADYSRRAGTRYVFGAYDVGDDRLRTLRTRMRPRRRGSDVLAFMRQIRLCYRPRIRIYWTQDNLSANWTPAIREFADDNNIELVPTPTYASYLNPVECHFAPIGQFCFGNADTSTGRPRAGRSCATSAIATAPTATGASPSSSVAIGSPPERWRFGCEVRERGTSTSRARHTTTATTTHPDPQRSLPTRAQGRRPGPDDRWAGRSLGEGG